MQYQKVRDEIACVVVGSFTPETFHPDWFGKHGLIADVELQDNDCTVDLVHRDISRFNTAWLKFEAMRDRIQVSTTDLTRSENLKDLVSSILEIFTEANCKQIGFNRILSFGLNVKDFHRLGDAFAPKKLWNSAFDGVDDKFGKVGLKSLEYRLNRNDHFDGYYMVNLFPSGPEEKPEVTFRVNDHIELRSDSSAPMTVRKHWRNFETNSEEMVINLLKAI